MKNLKLFIVGVLGGFGALLWFNEYDSFWTIFVGALCFVIAVCLYRKWDNNDELDSSNPII